MAALLAGGPGAALGYGTAGSLWELTAKKPEAPEVHIFVIGRDRGRTAGLRPHRVETLPQKEVTVLHGMRVTTPARTFVDLSSVWPAREIERALARAERSGLIELKELRRVVARHPGRPGIGTLRRLLGEEGDLRFTRSEAEERFLALVGRARLPEPEVNVAPLDFEVDFLWRSRRLVVEVDGFGYHSSKVAFHTDRRRDADLVAAGFRVIRVTWEQLQNEAEAVAAQIGLALGGPDRG